MNIPRPEHPKPQFEREQWLNLNGEWSFEIDDARCGLDRELYRDGVTLKDKIIVPFCPESKLSGVCHPDFMYGVVYKRSFTLPQGWEDGVTKIHFGAVDYKCQVFVNETYVGSHAGGFVSFAFDATRALHAGENTVTVFAHDDTRDPMVPRGKQCERYIPSGYSYTRTTGIWQTVWLEHMPTAHIERVKYYTDIDNAVLTAVATVRGEGTLTVRALYEGREVGCASAVSGGGDLTVCVQLSERHLWELGNGRLYDLELTYGEDKVKSYFGLRSVALGQKKFYLNGKSVFQRLVLDQGFYPDGVLTAPSEADMVADIERVLACGFNGARLHEKIFEERFLYHCDRMGYMVWGEYPDWGLDHSKPEAIYHILPEWMEEIERDFNHPSIVCWCPHNETGDRDGHRQYDEGIRMLYRAAKGLDPTRPCVDASGWFHIETDIYDVHNYDQNPENLRKTYAPLADGTDFRDAGGQGRQVYRHDKPFHVSEYGGISYAIHGNGFGYGATPESEKEFLDRFGGLTCAMLENPDICGFCYTQFTDVEQEQNGLYTYERQPKFSVDAIKAIVSAPAAIELEEEN